MSNRCCALVLSLILAAACLPLAAQTYSLQAFSLPYAPQSDIYATGINNRGAVVGYFRSPKQLFRGFKRNADGVFEPPIDDPNSVRGTFPAGINDSGLIVGYYDLGLNLGTSGFLLSQVTFTDFSHGFYTRILGVNNLGDFVGSYLVDQFSPSHGFVSKNGIVSDIDVPAAGATFAQGIAADGTIVGAFTHLWYHGFLRGPAGQYKTFRIASKKYTYAYGINNAVHKIVGAFGKGHGFVYDYITGVVTKVDWPDPYTKKTVVTGINSHGVIVGYVVVHDAQGHQLPTFSFIGTPQ